MTSERRSVLVIDDSPEFVGLAERALRSRYSVLTAMDALDGYALLCQHQPDVVILDIMMPVVNGWLVLRKIRSNPAVANARVIVMTGLDSAEAHREAERIGVASLVFKPVTPTQMVAAVDAALAADKAGSGS